MYCSTGILYECPHILQKMWQVESGVLHELPWSLNQFKRVGCFPYFNLIFNCHLLDTWQGSLIVQNTLFKSKAVFIGRPVNPPHLGQNRVDSSCYVLQFSILSEPRRESEGDARERMLLTTSSLKTSRGVSLSRKLVGKLLLETAVSRGSLTTRQCLCRGPRCRSGNELGESLRRLPLLVIGTTRPFWAGRSIFPLLL